MIGLGWDSREEPMRDSKTDALFGIGFVTTLSALLYAWAASYAGGTYVGWMVVVIGVLLVLQAVRRPVFWVREDDHQSYTGQSALPKAA